MKGDFTRLTFQREKHFSRVLRQQGRVTLDADDNEQTAILLHYLRTLARDLIGPYAAPSEGGGFALSVRPDNHTLILSGGRYYVDGILIENEDDPYVVDNILLPATNETAQTAWLYLDVWERHVTSIEDDTIREKALGGPDTCTRAQVIWQVKSLLVTKAYDDRITALDKAPTTVERDKLVKELKASMSGTAPDLATLRSQGSGDQQPSAALCSQLGILLDGLTPMMVARVDPGAALPDPCVLPPDAKYRGMENQLYRVEIQRGGVVADDPTFKADNPTFKWSRDNGSVVTAWLDTDGNDLEVAHGRGFTAGNWVELSDDVKELGGEPGLLVKLTKVEGNRLTVDPTSIPAGASIAWDAHSVHPKVRRWDQVQRDDVQLDEGAVPVQESTIQADMSGIVWLDLEDGIQVAFTAGGEYRTGDYWLIPARVATGTIEWPDSMALPPHGVEHHYAPLGFVWWAGNTLTVKGCGCAVSVQSTCSDAGRFVRPAPRPIDLRAVVTPAAGLSPAPAPPPAAPTRRGRKPG